jgi:hypothetical protein
MNDPRDHAAVIDAASATLVRRQKRLDDSPLLI